jgi:type IV secretion system protein VirD4
MTPTKLLIGQILVVFLIMILGIWGATQWAAAMLGYQPELGAPLGRIGHFIIYRPWDLFGWWYHFDAYAPQVFDKAGALAARTTIQQCHHLWFSTLGKAFGSQSGRPARR